jgi:hypothetical protein
MDGLEDEMDGLDQVTPIETSFMVYDKDTQQYKPALRQPQPQDQNDFFNDPVRIVVPNKRDAKASRTAVAGTGNRYFKRGNGS